MYSWRSFGAWCLVLGSAAVPPAQGSDPQTGRFTDIAEAVGLEFRHVNGMSGELYLVEIMGSGAAVFDYDNDGDLDVYLVQGCPLTPAVCATSDKEDPSLSDRLYRNDTLIHGPDGLPVVRFTDVTRASGIKGVSYGMGVASGDFDNDGWVDLYVTNFGGNRLWRNKGDGTFEDVTATAGVGDQAWSVSAAFLDYDRDGWLDLFTGNYLRLDLSDHEPCRSPSSALDYCTPLVYPAEPDRLYRNRGDGTFEDVSVRAGVQSEFGPALGVVVADYNNDGWPDLYVANDSTPNQLWINLKDGRFRNDALLAGAAVNMAGSPEGSMGVAVADFDGDGDEDLFMTHLTGETNTLYVNDGSGWFEDRSIGSGLGGPSTPYTGFGAGWVDVDGDGLLDLFTANGEVSLVRRLSDGSDPLPLRQTNQLFLNRGDGGFVDVSEQGGAAFRLSEVSRGTAFGDIDNDGDTDILVVNNNGSPRLLSNNLEDDRTWLGFRVLDRSGRDALGARVEVVMPNGKKLWRTVRTDGSYASASDPRVLFGLPRGTRPDLVRVHWPNGETESWAQFPLNRYNVLRYGRATTGQGDGP